MRTMIFAIVLCCTGIANADLVVNFRNPTGANSGTLGELLDLKTSGTFAVPGGNGLTISIVDITVNGVSGVARLNGNDDRFGIDTEPNQTGDDTDQFEASLGESVTFSFNFPVSVTWLDFVSFGDSDVFSFAGSTFDADDLIGDQEVDLMSTPIELAANQSFTLSAVAGSIGLQSISLAAVPEPTAFLFGSLVAGSVGMVVARRRPARKPLTDAA